MPRQKWSAEIVVSAIKKLRKQGVPLNSGYVQVRYGTLLTAACRYCGSWKNAVESAGIPYHSVRLKRVPPNKKWSADLVVRTIKELRKQGIPLNPGYGQKHHAALATAACTYCGSWEKAVEAAGIPYSTVMLRTRRSKESIIKEIQAFARTGPLNSRHVTDVDPGLVASARGYFGGWDEALRAAGFDPSAIRLQRVAREWSKAAIVAAIKSRVRAGKSIAGKVMEREDKPLYAAAAKHFGIGGWAKARVLAGFTPVDPPPYQIWSKKTVAAAIRRLHKDGVLLHTFNMVKTPELYRVYSAGHRIFGTWEKAVGAAGLDYSKIRRLKPWGWWTKKRVIATIRSLERHGVRLNPKTIQYDYGDLFNGGILQFGSWSQAVEAAGISYRMHMTRWSTKTWLRRMQSGEYENIISNTHRHAHTRRRTGK